MHMITCTMRQAHAQWDQWQPISQIMHECVDTFVQRVLDCLQHAHLCTHACLACAKLPMEVKSNAYDKLYQTIETAQGMWIHRQVHIYMHTSRTFPRMPAMLVVKMMDDPGERYGKAACQVCVANQKVKGTYLSAFGWSPYTSFLLLDLTWWFRPRWSRPS